MAMPTKPRMTGFEEVYLRWCGKQLTQGQAASLLGISERTFRRYVPKYRAAGMRGLEDRRTGISHRRAPSEEVSALEALYAEEYAGWKVRHFHKLYQSEHGGRRSYTWVKNHLQAAGLVTKCRRKVPRREQRPRKLAEGMMIHQDGLRYEWVPRRKWELIMTADDATDLVYSGILVEKGGMWSSFRGVRETLVTIGMFDSLCTDWETHYWHTSKAAEGVDQRVLTQFGRAMKELGIEMIPSDSRRGRIERLFGLIQRELPQELELAAITDIDRANAFLRGYWPKFNALFGTQEKNAVRAFKPLEPPFVKQLDDIFCRKETRKVDFANRVSYHGRVLQIPPHSDQHDDIRSAAVRVHEYEDGSLAVFHGRFRLGRYEMCRGSNGRIARP